MKLISEEILNALVKTWLGWAYVYQSVAWTAVRSPLEGLPLAEEGARNALEMDPKNTTPSFSLVGWS